MKPGEPVWLDDDRRWALAWQYDQDVLRLPCGHYRDEASGRDNVDRWTAIPRVCHACEAVGQSAERRREHATKADAKHGLFWQLQRDEG